MPSTIQFFSQAITDFKKLQDVLFEKQSKVGADTKASTFSELGSDIPVVQNYEFSISSTGRFINSIQDVSRKLDASYNAVDNIIETAISFKRSLSLETSTTNANVNDLTGAANAALDGISGELNAKEGSKFLFAGSKVEEAPVSDLKRSSNYVNGKVTANYYKGDDFKDSVDVTKSLQVEYGVTASDPAFQKVIAAINLSKDAEGKTNDYTQAGKLIDEAINDLISLRSRMGNNSKILQDNLAIHEKAKSTLEQKLGEVNSPDVVQLSIEISNYQSTLQASLSTFSKISSISLLDFLK